MAPLFHFYDQFVLSQRVNLVIYILIDVRVHLIIVSSSPICSLKSEITNQQTLIWFHSRMPGCLYKKLWCGWKINFFRRTLFRRSTYTLYINYKVLALMKSIVFQSCSIWTSCYAVEGQKVFICKQCNFSGLPS